MPYLITTEHLAAIAGRATSLMPGLAEWLNATKPFGVSLIQFFDSTNRRGASADFLTDSEF